MPSHYFFLTSVKTVTGSPCPSLSCCLNLSQDGHRFPFFRRFRPASHPHPSVPLFPTTTTSQTPPPPPSMVGARDAGG
ncbi:hypothetical protein Hanom_Chr01g00034901 [Helianthus anomalus]